MADKKPMSPIGTIHIIKWIWESIRSIQNFLFYSLSFYQIAALLLYFTFHFTVYNHIAPLAL